MILWSRSGQSCIWPSMRFPFATPAALVVAVVPLNRGERGKSTARTGGFPAAASACIAVPGRPLEKEDVRILRREEEGRDRHGAYRRSAGRAALRCQGW